jgi:hypothetical protein
MMYRRATDMSDTTFLMPSPTTADAEKSKQLPPAPSTD